MKIKTKDVESYETKRKRIQSPMKPKTKDVESYETEKEDLKSYETKNGGR